MPLIHSRRAARPNPFLVTSARSFEWARIAFVRYARQLAGQLIAQELQMTGSHPVLPRDPLWQAAMEYRAIPSEYTRRRLLDAARAAATDNNRLADNYGCPLYRAAVAMHAREAEAKREVAA